ncbi:MULTISPECIES: sulfatase-like hydrolase/transferase [unclassified Lentimonas]|uniref:sulfatase-like hydrolase/transferase n=1 Tax=unclassified Lentimonas TaxID=2630993 RepID=UPI0038B34853
MLSDRLNGIDHPASYIREERAADNNGGDNDVIIGCFRGNRIRGLLSFDLSSLPAGAVIDSVDLSLYNDSGFGKVTGVDLHQLKGSFVEGYGDGFRIPAVGSGASWNSRTGSEDWNTPGGDFYPEVLTTMPGFDCSEEGYRSFPSSDALVTSAQQAQLSGEPLNLLLKAMPETGNRMCRFSADQSTADQRPVLQLTYSMKPVVAADSSSVKKKKPNILFIAVDDLRPELGCYGSEVAVTPNMDRLASEGLLFERAYCQQAICGPSRASIMTGARPDTTGITHNYVKIRELNPDILTLPQQFGANGYDTVFCGKIYHHGDMDPQSWNREPSFDKLPTGVAPSKDGFALEANQKIKAASRKGMFAKYGEVAKYGLAMGPAYECADVPDNTYIDGYHTDLAIETLKEMVQEGDKPFFLGFGMNKPHLNWVAPKKYWDLYDHDAIPLAAQPEGPEGGAMVGLHPSFELRVRDGIPKSGAIDDEMARTLKHSYLACVSYVDAQIGRMIDALNESGVRDNTIIILWSDHGFHLGEMGIWCKATNYELATRVPLMIWTPELSAASQGQRTDALVELLDIYPTLCDLAGLELPEHLEGTSFKPLLEDPTQAWKAAAFSQFPSPALREWGGFPIRPAMRETYFGPLLMEVEDEIKAQMGETWDRELFENHLMGYAMRTDRYRFIAWKDTQDLGADPVFVELYDHEIDPTETKNVADDNPQLVAQLLQQLNHNLIGSTK